MARPLRITYPGAAYHVMNRGASRQRVTVRSSVTQTVANIYGVSRDSLRTGCRGLEGEARKVAGYFVPRLCDWTLQHTANYFGLLNYGGVSWAGAQVRSKCQKEKAFRDKLSRIEKQILQQ